MVTSPTSSCLPQHFLFKKGSARNAHGESADLFLAPTTLVGSLLQLKRPKQQVLLLLP